LVYDGVSLAEYLLILRVLFPFVTDGEMYYDYYKKTLLLAMKSRTKGNGHSVCLTSVAFVG
jgi:hypothetical protein